MKPAIERTRVASAAAMRARDVSRDREAEAQELRRDGTATSEPATNGRADPSAGDQPQPADRLDS